MSEIKNQDDNDRTFRVAILLAAFNGLNYIQEQIESIYSQKKVLLHIFISVDYSTDGTYDYIKNLADNNENITLLPNIESIGSASGNFYRLIRDVNFDNFDYIAFADQDDIWYENKIFRACSELVRTKKEGYSSNVTAFWINGKRKLIKKNYNQTKWDYLFESAGPGCTYVLSNKLATHFKQKLIQNWDIANSIFFHDWLIYAFARNNDYGWIIDSEVSMLYRQHDNNVAGANSGTAAIVSRLKVVFGKWAFEQIDFITKFLEIESDPFVKKYLSLKKLGFLGLATRGFLCRRNVKDKLIFIIVVLIFSLKGLKLNQK